MIPVCTTSCCSEPANFPGNYRLGLFSSMTREDEPSKPKVTPVTKLLAWKIPIVEETEKLAVIHRTSAS
jgi:hypothetical protein